VLLNKYPLGRGRRLYRYRYHSHANTNPRPTGLRRLPISWREILGLLLGGAICCGIIGYTLTNAPRHHVAATGQPSQRSAPVVSDGNTKTVTLRVTGSSGARFSGNVNSLEGSHSLDGVVPADYRIEVRANPLVADFLYATVQKAVQDDKELRLQILDDGRVAKEGSTAVSHEDVVSLIWSPEERGAESTSPQETTSTHAPEKALPATPPNNAAQP
jgi:hypothetical protein